MVMPVNVVNSLQTLAIVVRKQEMSAGDSEIVARNSVVTLRCPASEMASALGSNPAKIPKIQAIEMEKMKHFLAFQYYHKME